MKTINTLAARVVLFTTCLFQASASIAQDGTLDLSFDSDGIVTTPVGSSNDVVYSIALQSDGKIVAGGNSGGAFALARYNTNGTLDNTFGTAGTVTTGIGTGNAVINSVAIQADGKIVAAGLTGIYPNLQFALARYNTNGTLDNTFDTDGRVTTDIGADQDRGASVVIQSDGKILVAGSTYSVNTDCALIRYNSDGSLDNTFDSDGVVTTVVGTANDLFRSVTLQADGKIVAGGFSYVNAANYQFLLARYHPNGALDNTFDSDGLLTTDIVTGTNDYGESVHIQSDGKIVLAGYSFTGSLCLVRYNSDGSYDSSFGTNGEVNTPFGGVYPNTYTAALQSDGKILIGGYSNLSSVNSNFALARYTSSGILDTTFGISGMVNTPIGSGDDIANTVAIQQDSKIVLAGKSNNGTNDDFAVVRYNNSISTGTDEASNSQSVISIYPNPFYSTAVIRFDSAITNGEVNLYDIYGQRVKTINNISGEEITLHRYDLPAGLYFIQLKQGGKTIPVEKLVLVGK